MYIYIYMYPQTCSLQSILMTNYQILGISPGVSTMARQTLSVANIRKDSIGLQKMLSEILWESWLWVLWLWCFHVSFQGFFAFHRWTFEGDWLSTTARILKPTTSETTWCSSAKMPPFLTSQTVKLIFSRIFVAVILALAHFNTDFRVLTLKWMIVWGSLGIFHNQPILEQRKHD